MISMKKNTELFFILEMLLLTPIALFWVGLVSMFLSSSNTLFTALVGEPFSTLRAIFVTIICPLAAGWFAYEYVTENKKDKSAMVDIARTIIAISGATIAVVVIYLVSENFL